MNASVARMKPLGSGMRTLEGGMITLGGGIKSLERGMKTLDGGGMKTFEGGMKSLDGVDEIFRTPRNFPCFSWNNKKTNLKYLLSLHLIFKNLHKI